MTEGVVSSRDPLMGARIDGRYRVLSVLGRGGMGVVYAAMHEELERPAAIKVLNPAWASDPEGVTRFLREARVASSLSHPNIVAIWDLGRLPDGRPYLVMPQLAGIDLATLLTQEGPQHPSRVAALLAGGAAALDLIHAKGFVHRDIKPENLLHVTGEDGEESVMVLDFGIASAAFAESRLTQEGVLCGTPDFLPPEALSGAPPDRRFDVYALATVAFEMITGRLPFSASNPYQLLPMKVAQPAPSMSAASGREFPDALEAAIARGLAIRPEQRYASAGEFVEALAAAAEQCELAGALQSGATRERYGSRKSTIRKAASASSPRADQGRAGAPDAGRQREQAAAPAAVVFEDELDDELPWLRRRRIIGRTALAVATLGVLSGALFVVRAHVSRTARMTAATAPSRPEPPPSPREPPAAERATLATAPPQAADPAPAAAHARSERAPRAARDARREERRERRRERHARQAETEAEADQSSKQASEETSEPPSPPEPPPALARPHAPVLSIQPTTAEAPTAEPPPQPAATPEPVSLSGPGLAPAPEAEPAAEVTASEPDRSGREQARELNARAIDAMLQGQLASALQLFERAAQADRSYAAAYRGKGLTLQQLGRPHEAAQAFREYLRLEPRGTRADAIRERLDALAAEHAQ